MAPIYICIPMVILLNIVHFHSSRRSSCGTSSHTSATYSRVQSCQTVLYLSNRIIFPVVFKHVCRLANLMRV